MTLAILFKIICLASAIYARPVPVKIEETEEGHQAIYGGQVQTV